MTNKVKVTLAILAALVIGFLAGAIGVKNSVNVGVTPQTAIQAIWQLVNGVTVGATNQFQIDRDGNLTTSGTLTASGALSVSGAMTTTGSFSPDSIGSGVLGLSSGATTSVSAANLGDYTVVEWAPTVANASATLPSAVALQADFLDVRGGYRDILWENTSVAGSSTIFIAGASSTLEYVSSTGSNGALSGGDGAILRIYNSTSSQASAAMVKIKVIPFND